MPIAFSSPPEARFVIFVKQEEDRRVVILIEGFFDMDECVNFVMRYPSEVVTEANAHTVPIASDCFNQDVHVQVRCFTMATPGQTIPAWLNYITREYGGRLRFIDAYTFHVERHALFQYANYPVKKLDYLD